MKLRIAQIRIVPEKGNLKGNFKNLLRSMKALEKHRPDVVITPECFLDGYVTTEKSVTRKTILKYAIDPQTSPYTEVISEWAARSKAWVVFGCTRKGPLGAYNSALIFDRGGKIVGIYDKVHCQLHDRKYVQGDSLPVFDSDFGPFGVMICADRRWPETVRTLALKGARVIFNPTYGMFCDLNLAMMRTRSFENEVLIAFTHVRQSLITGPEGEVLCNDRRKKPRFSVNTLDLKTVDRCRRKRQAHLRDRQVHVYEEPAESG